MGLGSSSTNWVQQNLKEDVLELTQERNKLMAQVESLEEYIHLLESHLYSSYEHLRPSRAEAPFAQRSCAPEKKRRGTTALHNVVVRSQHNVVVRMKRPAGRFTRTSPYELVRTKRTSFVRAGKRENSLGCRISFFFPPKRLMWVAFL